MQPVLTLVLWGMVAASPQASPQPQAQAQPKEPAKVPSYDAMYEPTEEGKLLRVPTSTEMRLRVPEPNPPYPGIPGVEYQGIVPNGWAVMLGGGMNQFSSGATEALTGRAGAYEVRLLLGADSVLGFEAAYVGSAQSIDALGLEDDARLLTNGGEGNIRINVARIFLDRLRLGAVTLDPFITGGGGWSWFSVHDDHQGLAAVADDDDVLTAPLGAGLSAQAGRTMFDVRYIYRIAYDEELARSTTLAGPDGLDLSTWGITARAGVTF